MEVAAVAAVAAVGRGWAVVRVADTPSGRE